MNRPLTLATIAAFLSTNTVVLHTPVAFARARCADFSSQEEAKASMLIYGATYLDLNPAPLP